MGLLGAIAWLACVVYSTIPLFWFMIHPRAHAWRQRSNSSFRILVPAWILMWAGMAALTGPWRHVKLYSNVWAWIPACLLFAGGFLLYSRSGTHFSLAQLAGLPEVQANHRENRLVTSGIRAYVRHPVYLAHLCEMLAWSLGSGLAVCWVLPGFAIATGTAMIRMEDAELAQRFGAEFLRYRERVGAVIPRFHN